MIDSVKSNSVQGKKKTLHKKTVQHIYVYILCKMVPIHCESKTESLLNYTKESTIESTKICQFFPSFHPLYICFLTFHSILFLFDCFSFAFFRSNHTFAPGAQNTHKCKMLRSDCKPHSKYLHANDNCSSPFYHSLLVSRYAWAIRMCTSQCSGQIGSAFQSIFLLVFSHFFFLFVHLCICFSVCIFIFHYLPSQLPVK